MLINQYESDFSIPVEDMKILDPESFFNINEAKEQLDSVFFDRLEILDALDKLSPKEQSLAQPF